MNCQSFLGKILGRMANCADPDQTAPEGESYLVLQTDMSLHMYATLSLPLIQEGQLSVSGERMCTILVNHLED